MSLQNMPVGEALTRWVEWLNQDNPSESANAIADKAIEVIKRHMSLKEARGYIKHSKGNGLRSFNWDKWLKAPK
jgi:hypothetical protein